MSVAPSPSDGEFEGLYVHHWEAPRFVVDAGRGPFGLWRRVELWMPRFSDSVADFLQEAGSEERRGPPRYYHMRVRGRLGPKGAFGHKGMCHRELHVTEILDSQETSKPGKIW